MASDGTALCLYAKGWTNSLDADGEYRLYEYIERVLLTVPWAMFFQAEEAQWLIRDMERKVRFDAAEDDVTELKLTWCMEEVE